MKIQAIDTNAQTDDALITNVFVESGLSILGFLLFLLLIA